MANPQKENGYTAIANEILEKLVNTSLLGSEFQVLFFIIRKTYGYQKKADIISLSQFQKGTGISRPTIVKTIKNLISRNMIVKIYLPEDKISFSINKDYDSWVVNTSKLVKGKWVTSKHILTETSKDVLTHKRNKENTKEIILAEQSSADIVKVIDSFKVVNPAFKKWYGNKTQRASIQSLIESHGLAKVLSVISILPKTNGISYVTTITTPQQLEDRWATLEAQLRKMKNEKSKNIITKI